MSDGSESRDSGAVLQNVAKGAGIVFIGTFVQLGIAFFAKALIARFLEVQEYGIVSLGIVVLNIGVTLSLLGLNQGVARFVPRYDDENHRAGIVFTSYEIALPTSLAVTAALYFFADEISVLVFRDPSIAPILRILVLAIPFWVLLDLGVGTTRGLSEALPRVYSKNILLPSSRFAFVAAVFLLGLGITGVAYAYVASYAIVGLIMTYLVIRRIPMETTVTLGMRKSLLFFSLPLILSQTSSFLTRNVDLLLLGFFHPPSQVGIYNVAYPIARLLNPVSGAFGFLFMPVVSGLHADGESEEARRVYQITAKWILLTTLPIFVTLFFFPEMVIKILFGAKYVEGGLTLSVLVAGFLITNMTGPNGGFLTSIGRSRLLMIIQVLSLGSNIGLNLLLIPDYGFLGAGVATAASYLFRDALIVASLYRITGVQPFTRSMVRPTLITTAITVPIYAFATSFLRITIPLLIALFVLFIGVYGVAIIRFGGIEQEDVMMFDAVEDRTGIDMSPIRRIVRRIMG